MDWATIGVLASIIIPSIGALVWVVVKVSSNSFDAGKHSKRHENLDVQVNAAHDKIRNHADRLAAIEKTAAANEAIHEAILGNQAEQTNRMNNVDDKLDKVLFHLMGKS